MFPQIDHINGSKNSRMKGLSPRLKSALFLLKNDLFPTRERLLRCNKAENSICNRCYEHDTQGHFIVCLGTQTVCLYLVKTLELYQPSVTLEQVVNCDIKGEESEVFAVMWVLALTTEYVWDCTRTGRNITPDDIHGILSAELEILTSIPQIRDKAVKLFPIINMHLINK